MKKALGLGLALVIIAGGMPARAEVPAQLVAAIIQQESQGNPLALNVAGRSHYPATMAEALGIIQTAQEKGLAFDVGLMQINSWWLDRLNLSVADLLDPQLNVATGTWILDQELARHGQTWQAVGRYHSPDMDRGRRYAWEIFWKMQNGGGHAAKSREQTQVYRKNLPDRGGIWRNPEKQRSGKLVTFDIQPESLHGNAGSKPGAQRGAAGTP